MSAMQVFVSHSHVDNAFCVALVAALRAAGAEVWYDEHNLGSGQLMDVVQRELDRRAGGGSAGEGAGWVRTRANEFAPRGLAATKSVRLVAGRHGGNAGYRLLPFGSAACTCAD